MKAQYIEDNSEYLGMLNDTESRQRYFTNLAQPNAADHSEVAKVKGKINKMIEEEIALAGFKDQVSSEEASSLAADTYTEVATKSNFYFSIDEGKRDKNLKVFNMNAPGNHFRRPNVILPHENVHIQNYIDTNNLTDDKLFEIYGYYSLLVDMHIAQIRPGQVEEVSYIPPHLTQAAPEFRNLLHLNNMFFEHFHRWSEPAKRDLDNIEKKWQAQLDSRPETSHYDHSKGTPYDIEWTEDQKFPHVATRLGFPMLREEPIEKILGFERAPAHPGYQFQPFVKTPSIDPDDSLNFEQGEVIYENPGVGEWVKFWKAMTITFFGLSPGFYIFEIYAADGAPSLQWIADNWNWWDIPRQFQDGGGWDLHNVRYCDDHDYMNMQYGAKRTIVRASHTMYVAMLMSFIYKLDFGYVSKMRYNREKDLVFVTRPSRFWGETETVYEMHHLEQMVPSAVTAIPHMAANHKNGIYTVKCLA